MFKVAVVSHFWGSRAPKRGAAAARTKGIVSAFNEYSRSTKNLSVCIKGFLDIASSIKVPVNDTEPYHVAKENTTQAPTTIADEDSALNDNQMDEMRERVRRLIPYMTYYVFNNYVGQQQASNAAMPPPQSQPPAPVYANSQSDSPVILRGPSTPYVTLRPVQTGKSRYQVPVKPQEERFVPSLQYDPKGMEQDSDYFVPVRYGNKEPYDDYPISVRTSRPMPVSITSPEYRYHTTARPVSFLPPKSKPVSTKHEQDYVYGNQAVAPEEFESIRFVSKPRPPPTRYIQPLTPRPTVLEPVQQLTPRVSLQHVLKSLQLTNQLPEVLNKDNIDSSIKTLIDILNILNMGKKESYVPVYEKYKPAYTKPKVITESNYEATQISVTPHNELVEIKPVRPYINPIKTQMPAPHEEVVEIRPVRPYINQAKVQTPAPPQTSNKIIEYYVPIVQDIDEEKVPQVPQVHTNTYNPASQKPSIIQSTEQSTGEAYDVPEQHDEILEDERYTLTVTTEKPVLPPKPPTQSNTIPSPQLKYGVTRGKPHFDYPAYTEIPETDFSCKQQRYKGFFGDPQTGCQVWHYCDLNGGKSSFLCPNGTIFSQVALTCDWWFNVKCESTTQLYVLNERLYKYILPIMPKFPEDFTGPEVDKYLELKFKEMEAKMKDKKEKKEEEEKDKNTVNTLQSIEDSK